LWFDPGLAGLFITSTLLHLGEDINILVVSPTMFKDTYAFCKTCENCQKVGFISKHREFLDNLLVTFETYPGGDVHRAIHDL